MAAEDGIAVPAPAKINLYLHVTGRRDDGYHLLDSLVVFADVGDSLEAAPAPSLSLSYGGPFADALPPPEENLVLRAAHRLADAVGIDAGARLTLDKRLPVASGIGGGSADAAAALRALCRLWDIDPTRADVLDLALGLGADVPVCMKGTPQRMQGIGETLTPAPGLPPLQMVLVNPGIAVSTPAVFKARTGDFSPAAGLPRDLGGRDALIDFLRATKNDLETPAVRLAPVIGSVLTTLAEADGVLLARMSGSGATCFAITDDGDRATALASTLAAAHPDWWVTATGTR